MPGAGVIAMCSEISHMLGSWVGCREGQGTRLVCFFFMLIDQASELIYMHVSQARWTYFRDLCLHFGPGGLAGL